MEERIIVVLIVLGVILFLGILIFLCFKNFFKIRKIYKWVIDIDISKKRINDYGEILDDYINENHNFFAKEVNRNVERINQWYLSEKKRILFSKLFYKRKKVYLRLLKSSFNNLQSNFITFNFYRSQIRYRQKNYVKIPYTVKNIEHSFAFNLDQIKKKFLSLKQIGFSTSLKKYNSNNQRKLMNRELREKIMRRDNYTCQICGKYMPDEVGLQIDHIVPVSKGGKSIPSNLRVLCSKCNLKKRDKMY